MFIVQYATTPHAADHNQHLIQQVFAELHSQQPAGFAYASLRLADGVSFVHLVQADGDRTPLDGLGAFQRFQEGIGERITGPPVRSDATIVGSYRLLPEPE
ncbi:hypothetical protein GCM10009789_87590 [Kribbella sancticallisti]|uniref:Antibiotic biosynthesis monooxygenase n=1 Tax=Kribbella sancticallisti TaxID=460087 RepID=A0ABP4QWU3_9ACTN